MVLLSKNEKNNFPLHTFCLEAWPQAYKTLVQSQTQNKAQWLDACGHVSASSQSLPFILSLRLYSSFITSRPALEGPINVLYVWLYSEVVLVSVPVESLPVHLGCVNVGPYGRKWLIDNVYNKKVWFKPLYVDKLEDRSHLYSAIELPKVSISYNFLMC